MQIRQDIESGVTVVEEPYIELEREALKFTPYWLKPPFPVIQLPTYCALENAPEQFASVIHPKEPVILGNPARTLLPFTYKVDNYDNFLYNRKYERGIYKGCNGKIWRWASTGARKEVIK